VRSIGLNLDGQSRNLTGDNALQIAGDVLIGGVDREDAFSFDRILQVSGETSTAIKLTVGSINPDNSTSYSLYSGGTGPNVQAGLYISAGSLIRLLDGGSVGFSVNPSALPAAFVEFGTPSNGDGRVRIKELAGDGVAFVCLDSNGELYRSQTACERDSSVVQQTTTQESGTQETQVQDSLPVGAVQGAL
jgi:hypothetical protein